LVREQVAVDDLRELIAGLKLRHGVDEAEQTLVGNVIAVFLDALL
jgi:hypothetical protein